MLQFKQIPRRNVLHLTRVFGFIATLISGGSAWAITVAGVDPNTYNVAAGTGYDGVVRISTNVGTCTGSLMLGGLYVLTAGHCVTDSSGVVDVTSSSIIFDLPTGQTSVPGAAYIKHPGWTGILNNGNDLALIRLSAFAPAAAERYGIFRGTNELGQNGLIMGYGRKGTGAAGNTPGIDGIKRSGQNRYDAYGDAVTGYPPSQSVLAYDFDDGTATHDGFGFYFPSLADTGLGLNEVMIAPGDSGGPTFLAGLVAGVHSYGARGDSPPDNDGTLNSSFGEFGADTRVSYYAEWVDDYIVPEPGTWMLFALGLGGLAAWRRRTV